VEPRLKMMMATITTMTLIGHECEKEIVLGGIIGRRQGKGKDIEGRRGLKYATCICLKKHKETHQILFGKGGVQWRGEIVQSTLYIWMELVQ
jgi:hypothetical protein